MDSILLIFMIIKFLCKNVVSVVLVCMASSFVLAALALVLHMLKGLKQ